MISLVVAIASLFVLMPRALMAQKNASSFTSPEDFVVHGLEEVIPAYANFPGRMYAGMLPMDHDDSSGEMMFWMFEPTNQSIPDSIVIWLNGGPGCSSFNCGVLMEHSPITQPLRPAGFCCLSREPNFGYNQHTWTRATTMLYVEQPIGTGFSHGNKFPENEQDVSADLYAFLLNFFKVFEHLSSYDFYVMGESYAGMFVPSIGRYIHLENQRHENQKINLKGVALGNGWMNARVQGPAVIDYSWYHGLIDEPTRNALHNEWHNCMNNKAGTTEEPPPFHPFNVQDDCGIMWGVLQAAGNPNAYDISTWDPNVDQVTFSSEAFYNDPAVKQALHAPDHIVWHGCRQGEGRRQLSMMEQRRLYYMENDRPINVVPYVAELLDAGYPVLVYNGDRDMTTNMVGTELLLNDMKWSGKEQWLNASRGLWMVGDMQGGWAKEHDKLSFVVVYNSGHMVPYNQPIPAFDLLTRFLSNKSFRDIELPTIRIDRIKSTSNTTEESIPSEEPKQPSLHLKALREKLLVALVAFLVGILMTLFFNRKVGVRGDYQKVPDIELE